MKVTIKGNDITPEKVAEALRICEKDHGHISGMTIYIRYRDSLGRQIEPLNQSDGQEISREFSFWKPRQTKAQKQSQTPLREPANPISVKEMVALCQKQARRVLSSPEMQALIILEKTYKPDREEFIQALTSSVQKNGYFNVKHLERTLMR